MAEPLLRVRDLRKHYGEGSRAVRALDGLTLNVEPGETLAVVGESGSGKTTLANLILGTEHPTAGSIAFQGGPLPAKRSLELRRKIQYVQQNPMTTLNPRRTILQSIRLPLQTHHLRPRAEQRGRAAELLEIVGMSAAYLNRFPRALSGGQRQRVAIARALAVEPTLLVLDEPTSALDVSVQAKALSLLVDLQRRFDLTYLFITHDLSVVRTIASRVAVMYRGGVVEIGPTREVFAAPSHPYTRMLISSIPVVSEAEQHLKPAWPWERILALGAGDASEGCAFAPRCPFADEPCWREPPPLTMVGDDHSAACHITTGMVVPADKDAW